jgi:maleylpyruvate isomerase
MYASAEARDADIEELAAAAPDELRERFLAATGRFGEALEAMHEPDWEGRFERTPGGPDFALRNVVLMRLREVEIHHADLGAGYTADDWPPDFRAILLESMLLFGLESVEVSEADILHGAALDLASKES